MAEIYDNLLQVETDLAQIYEAGRDEGIFQWTQNYIKSASNDKLYAFAGPGWNDANYNPLRPMTDLIRTTNMYSYSNITDTKVPIKIRDNYGTNVNSTFQNATKLEVIRSFGVNPALSMNSQFTGCAKLRHLRLIGTFAKTVNLSACPLDKRSILSVIKAMSDTATGQGQAAAFNKAAVDKAFETSPGVNDGSESQEWADLVASKPKWTFTLT